MKLTTTAFAAAALVLAAASARATVQLGQPYRPSGQDYTITGQQNINSTGGGGVSLAKTQVNLDFEFADGIGVTYDLNGTAKPFGMGLYKDSAGATQSAGLKISFDSLKQANSVIITLADFDLKASDVASGKVTGFNPAKVEPGIVLFGAGGAPIANFDPATIFKSMTPTSGANGSEDYWKVDFATLLANGGVANQAITGFLLYATQTHGEKTPSDPYFLVNVSGVTVVPEPSTVIGGAALLLLVAGSRARRFLKNRA